MTAQPGSLVGAVSWSLGPSNQAGMVAMLPARSAWAQHGAVALALPSGRHEKGACVRTQGLPLGVFVGVTRTATLGLRPCRLGLALALPGGGMLPDVFGRA